MLTSIRRLYTSRSLTCLFGLALFTYNSWPLGFILNPSIVKIGLASVLEAANQPGRWVFIGLDIASSVLVMFAVVRLLWQSQKIHQGLKVVVSGWLLFSLGTCFDALLPLNCHQSIRRCGLGTQVIGLHDVLGGLAMVGVFLSLIGIGWWLARVRNFKLDSLAQQLLLAISALWAISGLAYVFFAESGRLYTSIVLQEVFIVMTSLCLLFTAFVLDQYYRPNLVTD